MEVPNKLTRFKTRTGPKIQFNANPRSNLLTVLRLGAMFFFFLQVAMVFGVRVRGGVWVGVRELVRFWVQVGREMGLVANFHKFPSCYRIFH